MIKLVIAIGFLAVFALTGYAIVIRITKPEKKEDDKKSENKEEKK